MSRSETKVVNTMMMMMMIIIIIIIIINPLNAELNPICYLLALLGAHHILHVSGVRVNHVYAVFDVQVTMHRDKFLQ